MIIKTERHECNKPLLFHTPSSRSFITENFELLLTYQDERISGCRLKFQVDPEVYAQIENDQLFNLKESVRGVMQGGQFSSNRLITIMAVLNPDFLPRLISHAAAAQQAAEYLVQLSQSQPKARLVATESWLGVSVHQDKISCRTLWDYVDWELHEGANFNHAIIQAIPEFANDAVVIEVGETAQDVRVKAQIIEAIAQFTQTLSAATSDSATGHFDSAAVTTALSNFSQTSIKALLSALDVEPEDSQEILELANLLKSVMPEGFQNFFDSLPQQKSLWESVIEFFQDNQWTFSQLEAQLALQLPFEGESGTWDCQAQVWEIEKQFNFYSVMPFKVPEHKRRDIAEFLTRSNYGLLLGNFEMDFADGEIRYKTSIDVQGSQLDTSLIRQVVHTNVLTMDQYLPGILQVLNEHVSPMQAIAQLEKSAA